MIGDQEPEPRRIEIRPGPDNPIGREPRQFPGNISQDINRVRNNEQNSIRGVLNKRRNDLPEEIDIPVKKIKPGLAGILAGPSGDDAEIGGGSGRVVSGGGDGGAREEGGGVLEVEHLAAELVREGVDEG